MMNDIIHRCSISMVGVLSAWGLMEFSLILASIASIGTILYTSLGIVKLIKEFKGK